MLYKITIPIYEEDVIETTVSVSNLAKFKTLADRIGQEVYRVCKGVIPIKTIKYEKPNIYTNGCFPAMWIECNNVNPIVDVFVEREDGLKVFS